MLYHRKAVKAPTTAKQKAAIFIWSWAMAIIPKDAKAMAKSPPESPSIPSITETAESTTVKITIRGTIKIPI